MSGSQSYAVIYQSFGSDTELLGMYPSKDAAAECIAKHIGVSEYMGKLFFSSGDFFLDAPMDFFRKGLMEYNGGDFMRNFGRSQFRVWYTIKAM